MNKKSFIPGSEGFLAKLVSLIFTIAFFSVYSAGTKGITNNWSDIIWLLLLFAVIYEVIGYVFFKIFSMMTAQKKLREAQNDGEVVEIKPVEEMENTSK
jgi:phosphotransferase system  glucose/maltose/N-acetylglucosamine-specific IIC component